MDHGTRIFVVVAAGLLVGTTVLLLYGQIQDPPSQPEGLSAPMSARETPLSAQNSASPSAVRHDSAETIEPTSGLAAGPSTSVASPPLELELASQRSKRLGRPLDGEDYRRACGVFRPGEPIYVAGDIRYNPLRISLTPEELVDLEAVKEKTYQKLEVINRAIGETENELANRAEAEGAAEYLPMAADGRVDLSASRPRNEDEVVKTIIVGTKKAYCVRFSPGVSLERDALLTEGTNAIQSGEEQLIAFFVERAKSRSATTPLDRR